MQRNKQNKNKKDNTPSEILEELKSPPQEAKIKQIPAEQLNKEAQERAKKRSLLQKIAKVFKRDSEPFRELIIHSEPLERRVALLVDGILEKFEVERTGEIRMVGGIFKGKIQNLEPGLKAAFVDIGQPKNAFLHYWDILPAAGDSSIEFVRENHSEQQRKREKLSMKDIPQLYPVGKDIVVQITKAQIGTKGPRVTTNISLPGRFLVLTPYSGQCGISRKIEDRKERERLKKILRDLTIPEGMGVIIRTAGEGKKVRYFIRDLHLLLKKWENICHKIDHEAVPLMLDQEPNILERTVRDFLTEDIDRILIDKAQDYEAILESTEIISPRSRSKITRYKDGIPIFERYNIERQIEQTFMKRVPLPSGGEIVLEETEALTAVDVNTGSHKGGGKDGKDYILQANLEAATEVSRQIHLRNIGGLIILDFIDMKNRKDRKAVFDCIKREMNKDKAKCHILPISLLGVMQMTRQRHSESTFSGVCVSCPYCQGRGIVKSDRSMSVEIQRKLRSILRRIRHGDNKVNELSFQILLHPTILERLRIEDEYLLIDIEEKYNAKLTFCADPAFHLENFKIIDPNTGREW